MSSVLQYAMVVLMLGSWAVASPLDLYPHETEEVLQEQEDPALDQYFAYVEEVLDKTHGTPSEETAALVAAYDPANDPRNPEELGSYYQGDILTTRNASYGRNGLRNQNRRWNKGIIPYMIAMNKFTPRSYAMIMNAIMVYQRNIPCIRLIPRTIEKDYVYIFSGRGCYSTLGRGGGRQELSLQEPGCTFKIGTPLHELMHAAGFLHEQSREDRDDYVDIHLENVVTGTESNFDKARPKTTTSFGVSYTYGSVMHYSKHAFSKNGEATISPKPDPNVKIGQRENFHPNDIKKLRAMYGC